MRRSAAARRYAKALILIGKEDGQAETYRNELNSFIAVLDKFPDLETAVTNPLIETARRRKILLEVVEKLSYSKVMKSFLTLLFDKKRFPQVRQIAQHYSKLVDELNGIVRAELISAMELTPDSEERIRQVLVKLTNKNVILESKVDPELIGGIVTRIGDLVLDGSIRTQLKNIRESLKRGESV